MEQNKDFNSVDLEGGNQNKLAVMFMGLPYKIQLKEIKIYCDQICRGNTYNIVVNKQQKFQGYVFIYVESEEEANYYTSRDFFFQGKLIEARIFKDSDDYAKEIIVNLFEPRIVCAKHVPTYLSEEEVNKIFAPFGKITKIYFPDTKHHNMSDTFIKFENHLAAKKCVRQHQILHLKKIFIYITWAKPRIAGYIRYKLHTSVRNQIADVLKKNWVYKPNAFEYLREIMEIAGDDNTILFCRDSQEKTKRFEDIMANIKERNSEKYPKSNEVYPNMSESNRTIPYQPKFENTSNMPHLIGKPAKNQYNINQPSQEFSNDFYKCMDLFKQMNIHKKPCANQQGNYTPSYQYLPYAQDFTGYNNNPVESNFGSQYPPYKDNQYYRDCQLGNYQTNQGPNNYYGNNTYYGYDANQNSQDRYYQSNDFYEVGNQQNIKGTEGYSDPYNHNDYYYDNSHQNFQTYENVAYPQGNANMVDYKLKRPEIKPYYDQNYVDNQSYENIERLENLQGNYCYDKKDYVYGNINQDQCNNLNEQYIAKHSESIKQNEDIKQNEEYTNSTLTSKNNYSKYPIILPKPGNHQLWNILSKQKQK